MSSPDISLETTEEMDAFGSPPSLTSSNASIGSLQNLSESSNLGTEPQKKKRVKKKKKTGVGDEDGTGEGEAKKKKKVKKGEKKATKKKKLTKKSEDGSLVTEPLLGTGEAVVTIEDGNSDEKERWNRKKRNSMNRPPEYIPPVEDTRVRSGSSSNRFNQSSLNNDLGEGEEEHLVIGGGGGSNNGIGNNNNNNNPRRDVLRLDNRRWFVLGVFCLASCSAMLVWAAISAASGISEDYYQMSSASIQLTRYWSVYLFPPFAIFSSWLLSLEKGVKHAVTQMGICSCIGALLILIPSFVGKVEGDSGSYVGKLGPKSSFGHFLVHLGEIVNALSTTMVFCAPCALSAAWFQSYQRRRATAIGGLIPMMGGLALCSVISPVIANKGENFFYLLLIIFLASLVIMIATLVVPALPSTPPSLTAARYRMSFVPTPSPRSTTDLRRIRGRSPHPTSTSSLSSSSPTGSSLAAMALEESRAGRAAERLMVSLRKSVNRYLGLFTPLKNPGPRRLVLVLFILAMALSFASLYVWQMSLTHVLISSKSAGTLGRASLLSLSHLVSGCGTALLVSWLCDLSFKRKARLVICVAQLVFAFLILLLLGLCLCSPSSIPEFLISKEFVIFHLVCIGLTVGATTPLIYELCCEMLYPVPEAVSFPFIAFFGSFIGIIVAAASPSIDESSFGTFICILSICESVVSTALIYFGTFKLPYFRLDVDEGRCEALDYQPI